MTRAEAQYYFKLSISGTEEEIGREFTEEELKIISFFYELGKEHQKDLLLEEITIAIRNFI